MKYQVCFTKYYIYNVEADNEEKAINIAEQEFESEMRRPIAADTTYDEVEVD